jgi:hypothetical protein
MLLPYTCNTLLYFYMHVCKCLFNLKALPGGGKRTWGRCYDHNFLRFLPIFRGKRRFSQKPMLWLILCNSLIKEGQFFVANKKIITSDPRIFLLFVFFSLHLYVHTYVHMYVDVTRKKLLRLLATDFFRSNLR